MAAEPQDQEPTSKPQTTNRPETTQGDPPSKRYGATVRLIESRLADAERTKTRPWWKWKP